MKKLISDIFCSKSILKATYFSKFLLFFFCTNILIEPIFAQKKKVGEPSERWKTTQTYRERVPPIFFMEIDNRYDIFAKKRKRIKKIQKKYADKQKQREVAEEMPIETANRHKKDSRKKKTPPGDIENDYLKLRKEQVQFAAEEQAIYMRNQELTQKGWAELVKYEFRHTRNTTPLEYDAEKASIAETAMYEGEYVIDLNRNRRMAFETASFGRDYIIKRRLQLIRRSSAFKIASKHHEPYQPLQAGIFFKTEKASIKGKPNYQRQKIKFRYDKKEAEMWRQLEENQKSSSREPFNSGSGFGGDEDLKNTTKESNNVTDLQEDTEETIDNQEEASEEDTNDSWNTEEETTNDGDGGWNTEEETVEEEDDDDDGDGGGN